MSKKTELAKNTLILSIGTFLPKLAGFITLPILTGYLSKAEYGTYDLITVLISLYLPQLTLQIKSAAFRFMLDVRENLDKQKEIVTNIFIVTLPISLIALLVLFFLLPGSTTIRLCICFYYLADIIVNTVRQISRGIGKNLPYSVSAIISALGKMIFAVLLVSILKMGLMGAVIALGMGSFLSMVYISIHIKIFRFIDFKLINKKIIKEMLAYSWPMVPNDMSMWVMQASDRLVVSQVLGVAVNAVYAASTKIPSIINLAQSALNLAWTENASLSVNDKDSDEYYTVMMRMMLNLQMGVFSVVIATMPILFKLLIKGDYMEAYNQMPILCYSIFFQGLALYLGGIYVAKKKIKSVGITSIGSAAVNLIVNLLLIHKIGIFAASISTLVSYIVLFTYRFIDVQKFSKIKMDMKQFIILQCIMITETILSYQQTILFYFITALFGFSVCILFNKEIVLGILRKMKSVFKI